jgi:hypothetical protein
MADNDIASVKNMGFGGSNGYINNLEHIYGSLGGGGAGLAIDYMYGMFFNSSGRNANLYIDSGNLNMINYNSGINIANYNSNGTGNVSLFSLSNDVYVATGPGRDVNINGGRYVSVNAAEPNGGFLVYASTMNTTSLLDTNITANRNMTLRADQFGNSITGIASTISLIASSAINLNGTTSLNSNLNMNNYTIYNAFELYNNNTDLLLSGLGRNITLQTFSGGGINLNGPMVANCNLNMNCNAISNVGAFTRYLISTELPQPVIQYAYVSTTGALSGTITVTLPQRYTSVNSYIPFAVVQNDATTTFYVSTITRATFEIGWSGYAGIGDIIFSWNCLGT